MNRLEIDVALDRPGFSLRVAETLALGAITAIFGPSGSGKTTLLRTIAGLESAARGAIRMDGEVWQDASTFLPAHERNVGYVFQDARLFGHLDVERNLRFAERRAAGRAASRDTITFASAVEALELAPLLRRASTSLSGGEQQRVAMARALLSRPRLLLMDEPLSSLDVRRKRDILPLVEQLPVRFGIPVLYVTHNLDEVARLASDVLLLAAGRVAAYDGLTRVFERPDLADLTGGLEAGVVLRARVAEHRDGIATLELGGQRLRTPATDAAPGSFKRVRILARDVAIATVRPERLSIRNILPARVERIDAGADHHVEILLDVGGERLRSRITREAAEELALAPNQEVFALVKSVALENTLLT
jgi:molybdate transport system ATP-binding protein